MSSHGHLQKPGHFQVRVDRETHDSCLSPSTEPGLAASSRQKLDAACPVSLGPGAVLSAELMNNQSIECTHE